MKDVFEIVSIHGKSAPEGLYEFVNTVTAAEDTVTTLRLFAATRYILYVNDAYVCEGPCRGSGEKRYYDTVEVALKKGENRVRFVVMHLINFVHESISMASSFKAAKPLIVFDSPLTAEDESFGGNWKCALLKNITLNFLPDIRFLPPCEIVEDREEKEPLETTVIGRFDVERGASVWFGINAVYQFEPRPIPMIYPSEEVTFRVVKTGEDYMDLDAGCYVTAKPTFTLAPHSHVTIGYSECYERDGKKGMRDDVDGDLRCLWYDTVTTAEREFTYTPFWFRPFRYIRIRGKNARAALVDVTARRCHYPLDIVGRFSCSDPTLNDIYKVSINTLLCCMHEIYVDCPYYEQQQYIMDTAIESNVTMRLSRDWAMVRKSIGEFAASQQPNGLLQANYPCTYIQIIPGFSFYFIFLLKDYLDYTKDVAFVKPYLSTVDKILNYFDGLSAKNGLVCTSHEWDYVDWADNYEHGVPPVQTGEAITVYNMYYACGLLTAARLCEAAGRYGLAQEYRDRYETLKETVNARCFDRTKGLYRDGEQTEIYSVHTIVWAILSELVSGEEAKTLAARIGEEGLTPCSFSMNYYLFRALEACDMYHLAFPLLDDWRHMLALHCTTWCESPGEPRSECHAWSSAPVTEFATKILGVQVGFEDEIVIRPCRGELTEANGAVPTRFGLVEVAWCCEEGQFTLTVSTETDVPKTVVLPGGKICRFTERTATFTESV